MTKYQKRISGPLPECIDIHAEIPRVDYKKLSSDRFGESSDCIRCRVETARESLIRAAMGQMNQSARGYHRVRKLVRTIANLAGCEQILAAHIAEALQYRPRVLS